MSKDADIVSITCLACGTRNPENYLFCVGCAKLLRSAGVNAAAAAQSDAAATAEVADPAPDAAQSDAPIGEQSGNVCGRCGAMNEAAYAFCVECGYSIRPKATPIAKPIRYDTRIDQPGASNRLRLRFTLFASALALALLAVVLAFTIGVRWAVSPALLAVISLALGLGRMSGRSLALLRQDVAAMLGAADMSVAPLPSSAARMQDEQGIFAERGASQNKSCGACSAVSPPGYRFCVECGNRLPV